MSQEVGQMFLIMGEAILVPKKNNNQAQISVVLQLRNPTVELPLYTPHCI